MAEISNVLNNYGTLEISENTNISNKGTKDDGITYPAIYNQSGATLTITVGTITSATSHAIDNYGTTMIQGGTITSEQVNTISNYGTLEISGNANISNDGTGDYPAVISQAGGTTTITGGSISSKDSYGIWNKAGGTTTIQGGTITAETSNAVNNYGTLEISGNANISSCNSKEKYSTVYNKSGATLTITGGTITNTGGGYGAYNEEGGNVTHTGGTISKIYGF